MSSTEEVDSAIVTSNSEVSRRDIRALRLMSFFNSSRFSDFIIKIHGREFRVHRLVVCAQSEYFERLFNGDWKENLNGVLELKDLDDDVDAVEAMVRFMYEKEYDSSGNSEQRMSPMAFNVRVYRVAHKYGVHALKQLSKEKFEHTTSVCWDMDDFPHVITDVYDTPECEELRETIARISHAHLGSLLKKDKFLCVLEETNGFAAGLVRLMAGASRIEYKCPSCRHVWEANLSPGHFYHCLNCGINRSDWESYAISRE